MFFLDAGREGHPLRGIPNVYWQVWTNHLESSLLVRGVVFPDDFQLSRDMTEEFARLDLLLPASEPEVTSQADSGHEEPRPGPLGPPLAFLLLMLRRILPTMTPSWTNLRPWTWKSATPRVRKLLRK